MSTPWYRQLWPWLIISGPAAVLVAGAATIWIAYATADGLVTEDYYKQGLAINKGLFLASLVYLKVRQIEAKYPFERRG